MPLKRALITGITGQDGSYLAELLLAQDYEVHGIVRQHAFSPGNIAHLLDKLKIYPSAIDSLDAVSRVVEIVRPQECYHLAAQTFVGHNAEEESETLRINISGTHNVLMALRTLVPACRLFYAASSEVFGEASESPQSEHTPFHPRSIYGIGKVASSHLVQHYRKVYGLHASCGLLYNHESPRRRKRFVTRKITTAVAAIKAGAQNELRLGDLNAIRDWGHAADFVLGMWQIVQKEEPGDYVLATGVGHTVQDFLSVAFEHAHLNWRDYVISDAEFLRKPDLKPLIGCYDKAHRELGWHPTIEFSTLVREMVDSDLRAYDLN